LRWYRPELDDEAITNAWDAEPEKHESWQAVAKAVAVEAVCRTLRDLARVIAALEEVER
jgi:hypothetical protein